MDEVRAENDHRDEPATPDPFGGRSVYLVGIGGCGMSGLARLLARRGAIVNGSDVAPSATTDALVEHGIRVGFDQRAGDLPEETGLVVASAAIRPDHPELLEAASRGVETITYAEALGRSMHGRTGVAVAGTHGKSTTVAMLGHTLMSAGLEPSAIVGATVPQFAQAGGAATGCVMGAERVPRGRLAGKPGLLLAEACEYNRSFHHLRPTIGAVTCVEADHLDVYGSLDAVVEAFRVFAAQLPGASEGGRLLIAHAGAHRREVTAGVRARVETYGFAPSADWQVTYDTASRRVGLVHEGRPVCDWVLAIPGEHMAMNSACAAILALWSGAKPEEAAQGLGTFVGLDRRLQLLGDVRLGAGDDRASCVRVYDDYGHHPTEIETTLRALREFDAPEAHGGRLICVFQPHQHSRTRFLLDEFASAFGHADVVIVPQIYFVRDSEQERTRVSASDLVDRLRDRGVRAMHLHPFGAIVEQLENLCSPGDLLVVMGAGPVWQIARSFMETVPATGGGPVGRRPGAARGNAGPDASEGAFADGERG